MNFTIYRKSGSRAGEIVRFGFSMLDADNQMMPGEETELAVLFEQTLDPETQYVVGESVASRPALPLSISKTRIASDGIDQCIIDRMPSGASVQIGERSVEPTDGAVILTSTIPGTYSVVVRHWPHLDFETAIEAA